MVINCQILLQKPKEGFYRPGNPVMGTVKYSFDKEYEFASINISLIGKGQCHWSERRGNGSTQHFQNKEEFLTQHNIIQESVRNGTAIYKIGSYEHPFHFILPDHLPSSFKSNTGHIIYRVIVKFEKPITFLRFKTFEALIPVRGYVIPTHPEPITFGLKKKLVSLTSNNHAISLKAEIDKTLVAPGESVNISITVNKENNHKINGIKAEIFSFITYTSDCGHKNMVKEYFKETIREVEIKGDNETIVVPTLPTFYSLQNSKIILGEYIVKVTAKLPFPHINESVEIPIVIGDKNDSENYANAPPEYSELVPATELMKEKNNDVLPNKHDSKNSANVETEKSNT